MVVAYGAETWDFHSLAMFIVYLIITILCSGLKISLPGVTGTMSVWFLFTLVGFIDMSFAETLILSCAATVVQCLWRAKHGSRPIQVMFNVSAVALATLAGFSTYHSRLWAYLRIGFPLPLGIAAIVFFLCNTLPIAGVIALTENKSTAKVWKQSYLWCLPYYFVGAAVAAAVSIISRQFGWEAALMTIPTVFMVFRAYQGYFEKLRLQKENAESQAQLAAIVESADAAIISEDLAGTVLTWNRGAERIYGYSSSEMIGQTMTALVPDDRREEDAENEVKLKRGVTVNQLETTRLTKSGTLIHLLLTISPIRDQDGTVCGMAHVAWDITQTKRLERQLAQAQKLESIGQLAAGIAHEINTPIQYIGDNTRFLENAFSDLVSAHANPAETSGARAVGGPEAIDEETLKYLRNEVPAAIGHMIEGIDQVARIVRAMKEFSHPSALEKVPVDLNRAIESTVLVSKNEWKYVAEVKTDLDPSLPTVPSVAGELNQVILNLIVNAAHAIGDVVKDSGKKGLIHIRTSLAGEFAEIRISDSGCGIPQDLQSKVFDPFFTTKPVGKGTGQGLAIAHSVVVQKHGGAIHLESEIGRGTTFVIQLPLVRETARA